MKSWVKWCQIGWMVKKKSESGCEVSGQRVVAADSYVDPTDHFGNESCHSFTWLCPGHQDDHAQWCWRGASPLSKRSENFEVDRFPCVPRLAQMACQPGWVWSGVPTTEIGQRPTLESEIPAGPDDTAIILGRISPRQCASLNLGDSLGIAPCLVWKSVEVSRL